MTTALGFDIDGTLVHRTRSYTALARETFSDHGLPTDDGTVELATDRFRTAVAALEPKPFERAMVAAVEDCDADADPAAMVETLRAATYDATTVPDAARDALDGLAGDHRLGVLTNGPRPWQVGKLDHHGLADQFDAVVTSYEAGAHKPDSAPFDLFRERLPAEKYVMVGDDYEADVEGSRAAGFVPIHYEGPDLWATIDALL